MLEKSCYPVDPVVSVDPISSTADVLWLFAALFDGPPPAPQWDILRSSVWPQLRRAVGNPELSLPENDVDRLQTEFDQWLSIPFHDRGVLAYPPDGSDIPDRIPETGFRVDGDDELKRTSDFEPLLQLTELLEVKWRKESFVAGRAFPVRPDHLSVLWAIWAVLVTMPPAVRLGGRPVRGWSRLVWGRNAAALLRLRETLPPGTAYAEIAEMGLAYGRLAVSLAVSLQD